MRYICDSNLLRSTCIYGVFTLVNHAIPFLLIPLLTRYLSPTDYGYVSVFAIISNIAAPLIGINFAGAYIRAYFSGDRFISQVYAGTVVTVTLVVGVLSYVFLRYRKM